MRILVDLGDFREPKPERVRGNIQQCSRKSPQCLHMEEEDWPKHWSPGSFRTRMPRTASVSWWQAQWGIPCTKSSAFKRLVGLMLWQKSIVANGVVRAYTSILP